MGLVVHTIYNQKNSTVKFFENQKGRGMARE